MLWVPGGSHTHTHTCERIFHLPAALPWQMCACPAHLRLAVHRTAAAPAPCLPGRLKSARSMAHQLLTAPNAVSTGSMMCSCLDSIPAMRKHLNAGPEYAATGDLGQRLQQLVAAPAFRLSGLCL